MQLDSLFKRIKDDIDCYEVNLHAASDDELLEISKRMGLALALPEMKRIKDYFEKQSRNPTDIELQALGQAWSEHCCYKSSKVPLKKYVFNVDEKRIIAREDAGVMEFDKDHYYCVALEPHNPPSAIEPYGESHPQSQYDQTESNEGAKRPVGVQRCVVHREDQHR